MKVRPLMTWFLPVLCLLFLGGCSDDANKNSANRPRNNGSSLSPLASPTPIDETAAFAQSKANIIRKIDAQENSIAQDKAGKGEIWQKGEEKPSTSYNNLANQQQVFLRDLKNEVSQLQTPSPPLASSTSSFVPETFIGISLPYLMFFALVLTGFFSAAIIMLLKRETKESLRTFEENSIILQGLIKDVDKKVSAVEKLVPDENLKTSVERLSGQVDSFDKKLDKAVKKNGEEKSAQSEETLPLAKSTGRTSSPATPPPPPDSTIGDDESPFPILAEEYLAKIQDHCIIAKADPGANMLILAQDGEGEWVLVENKGIPDEFYAIPRVPYIQSKTEFLLHYTKYYGCDHPDRGPVRIFKPAIFKKHADGWKYESPGKLEMR
jgi:hypothetical protein